MPSITVNLPVSNKQSYVARITGKDPKYNLKRKFLRPSKRWSNITEYTLEGPGLFEILEEGLPRYVILTQDGTAISLMKLEVDAYLNEQKKGDSHG